MKKIEFYLSWILGKDLFFEPSHFGDGQRDPKKLKMTDSSLTDYFRGFGACWRLHFEFESIPRSNSKRNETV